MEVIVLGAVAAAATVSTVVALRRGNALKAELASVREELSRFDGIIDVEGRARTIEAEIAQREEVLRYLVAQIGKDEAEVERLGNLLRSVEAEVDIQSYGFYEPHYEFETAEQYSRMLKENRDQQKNLVRDDAAAYCATTWSVEGSAAKGRRMVKQAKKLMLRAFNGECDAAVARVTYNNVDRLEARIEKAFAAINKMGKSNQIEITQSYLRLKLAELRLTHEHRVKKQEEKEEQRRIREQMREEQKAQKEMEQAQREAEKEEARKAAALQKARKDLAKAHGDQLAKLEELVARMETELQDAIEQKARAISRAQLTRSGHVYVISNIGSFGEGVYKIGMTRRLDPLDRVKELSGSSVPFGFDVHAMIYAEDAPGLENALHKEFARRRVNMINQRREFFRVSLEEIRQAVAKHHGIITVVTTPEAEEYRQTLAMLRSHASKTAHAVS